MKKLLILILVFVLASTLGASAGFAVTKYALSGGSTLTVYGYGADYTGYSRADVNSSGGYNDATGTKVRCKLTCGGVIKVDTSSEDTSVPYHAYNSGSASSSMYSNTWQLTHYSYIRVSPNSGYNSPFATVTTKSN